MSKNISLRLGDYTEECLEFLKTLPDYEGCSYNVIIGNLIREKLEYLDKEAFDSIPYRFS